jgi:ribosomal protein S18 acetylase RimI-like enzyme
MTRRPTVLHDPQEVERLLRRDPLRHLLALGDLDPAFWNSTICYYGHDQVVVVYSALELPVVLAHGDEPEESIAELIKDCIPLLPRRFYAQLSRSAVGVFEEHFEMAHHGGFFQMALGNARLVPHQEVELMTGKDLEDLLAFYSDIAFTDQSRFESSMLNAGPYFGIRVDGKVVSMAGTLVSSAKTHVAVLGNIATHSEYRRRGFASRTTSALCANLLDFVDDIGLNVSVSNKAAIDCYSKLGFEIVGEFDSYAATGETLTKDDIMKEVRRGSQIQ